PSYAVQSEAAITSLYPREPQARAKCRLIEDIADTQLDAALYAIAVVEMGRCQQGPEMPAAVALDLERIYSDLENALDADFFCGAYSLADIAVLPHLVAASFLGFVLDPQTRRVDGLGTDPAWWGGGEHCGGG